MMERELKRSGGVEDSPAIDPLDAKPHSYIDTPSQLGRPHPQAAVHQNYIDTPAQSDWTSLR